MIQLTEEELLRNIKGSESEFNTLAEIHKLLAENNMRCSIDEIRQKVAPLHRDGYLGKELTADGINIYYIIFNPEDITDSPVA